MSYLQFTEVPQPLNLRIELARNNYKLEPNCFGTAFFLLGVLPYDMVIFTGQGLVKEALDRMAASDLPRDNSIMISYNNNREILHASYIEKANPLEGYQREGSEGKFTRINSLSEVEDYLETLSFGSHFNINSKNFIHNYFFLKEKDSLRDLAEKIVAKYHPGWYD